MGGFEFLIDGFLKALQLISSGDPLIATITLLSLRVSVTATLLGAIFGIPTGFLIARKDFIGKSMVTTIVILHGLPPWSSVSHLLMLSSLGLLAFSSS
jgi:tungstate transport system permease protein